MSAPPGRPSVGGTAAACSRSRRSRGRISCVCLHDVEHGAHAADGLGGGEERLGLRLGGEPGFPEAREVIVDVVVGAVHPIAVRVGVVGVGSGYGQKLVASRSRVPPGGVREGLPFRTPGAAGYVIEKTWCSDSQRRSYFRTPRQTCDEGADPESLGSLGLSWNPLISCAFSSGAAAVTTFYTYPEPTLCTTARKLGWPVATVILDAESNPAHFPSGAAGEP